MRPEKHRDNAADGQQGRSSGGSCCSLHWLRNMLSMLFLIEKRTSSRYNIYTNPIQFNQALKQ
jgi:hypothetical protein